MKNLVTVLDWIRYAISQLSRPEYENKLVFAHGNFDAFGEAHSLVLGLLNLPYDLDISYFNAHLTNDEITILKEGLDIRINEKKPTPYITHRTLFMGLEFYVDERVLIPRSPIAELLENEVIPYTNPFEVNRILDLCCGSGCIGIAAAYIFEEADVVLADIDEKALEVAAINIEKHDVSDQVSLIQSDLFTAFAADDKFDLILSNPPYVDADTVAHLPAEFLHEPGIALGSGDDGLACTRQILASAANHLTPNGTLVVEVGASWDLLEQAYPEVNFNWHQFSKGGEGVFVMRYDELVRYQAIFARGLNVQHQKLN